MKILQDYIVPVVRLVEEGERDCFAQLHGTAFFINSAGAFITAAHVIRGAMADVYENGGCIALTMRKPDDDQSRYVGDIQDVTFADEPYDVAVGRVAQPSASCFAAANTDKVWAWEIVYAAGYAESALSRDRDFVRPDTRSLMGNVVRKVPAGRFLSLQDPHPPAFEVNFPIPHCMSGAPLVLRYGAHEKRPPGAPFPLLGVCVGTETISVGTDSPEQYGVVHDLWSLRDWKPKCLGGETLSRTIRPEE